MNQLISLLNHSLCKWINQNCSILILPILLLLSTTVSAQNTFIVSSSSSYEKSGWGKAFVVDGITTESTNAKGWSSNSNTKTNHEEWLQLDMQTVESIDGIQLFSRVSNQGFPEDFHIDISTNGNTWTTVVKESDYNVNNLSNVFPINTANARFVRIVGTQLRPNPLDNNQFRMQFTEVHVIKGDGLIEENSNNDIQYVLERIKPVKTNSVGGARVFDFGKAAFASLEFQYTATAPHTLTFHLGEKFENNRVDRTPGGTIRYKKVAVNVTTGTNTYQVELPPDGRNTGSAAIKMPSNIPVLMPFRYVEIENLKGSFQANNFTQLAYFGPWNETASDFDSDDNILNQIWDLCKYSIKATSFMGYYVDGDRERIPYEADAYINQLSHYTTDAEYAIARRTIEYLMANPTWPIEWHQHMPLMFYADYMYTGNTDLIAKYYNQIVDKSLVEFRRADGLISKDNAPAGFIQNNLNISASRFVAITDWPKSERDGYVFESYNNVINSFYYKDLVILVELANALGKTSDAQFYAAEAERVKTAFNKVFFNATTGLYKDGENTAHSSIHANLFPLAFGLVPENKMPTVVNFIKSKRMACSVYAAQYLLEGLFNAGEAEYALELLTDTGLRSWYNMIKKGSTITMESWDISVKSNIDWNHAWGAAPANIIPNYLWGIKPKTAGFKVATIQPQLASLGSTSVKMPTILGAIEGVFKRTANTDLYTITLPAGMKGEFSLPDTPSMNLIHNGTAKSNVEILTLNSGTHVIEFTDTKLSISFAEPLNGATYNEGDDIEVEIVTNDKSLVSNIRLFLNNQLVRQENAAPYEWSVENQNDPLLQNMKAGTYTLKAVATHVGGGAVESSITIRVSSSVPETCANTSNVALAKPTSQSSTSHSGVASRAVDGNSNGKWSNGSVTHTSSQTNSWWRVDLQDVYDLCAIRIYNRADNCCTSRIEGASVYAGNSNSTNPNDYTLIGSLNNITTNSFNNLNISARYIMVQHLGKQVLSLAEVEVNGSLNNRRVKSMTEISIMPNPTKDYINIALQNYNDSNVEYLISSLQGQIISTGNISTNFGESTPIDVSHLQNGVYLMHLQSDNRNTAAQKVVIIKE